MKTDIISKRLVIFAAVAFLFLGAASIVTAEETLLYEQEWYDGGTAATTAIDTANGVDYEAADNFDNLSSSIDSVVIYGLTLFNDGNDWVEMTPDPTEPFILRFYADNGTDPGIEATTTGTYEICLEDSYGDGWNGGIVSVYVDDTLVLDEITLASGSGPECHDFDVDAGQFITTVYVADEYPGENYYYIKDPSDTIIAEEGVGDETPASIGGPNEPDWNNPVSEQAVTANVTYNATIWDGSYSMYKCEMTLNEVVDLENGWISAQIDADNGSGTWFLWLNSLDGDLVSYQRIGESLGANLGDKPEDISKITSKENDNAKDRLGYDFGLELWDVFPNFPVINVDTGEGFDTIQAAIDDTDTLDGHTIEVSDGVFDEQVVIDKSLSIIGSGVDDTVITNTTLLTEHFNVSGENENYPIVYVHDVDGVLIQDLTVDGANNGDSNYRYQGIGMFQAGATLSNLKVINVRDDPFSGSQHGVGIYAFTNESGTTHDVIIENCEVYDFQKNAMALGGSELTVDVNNCMVTGAGPTNVTAQNGIQVGYEATGSISGNTVSDCYYTGSGWSACNILIYNSDNVDIIDNILTDGYNGISLSGDNGFISGNTITGSTGFAGISLTGAGSHTITDNIIDDSYIGVSLYQSATTNNIFNQNEITNNLYGVYAYASAGSGNEFNNNLISGNVYLGMSSAGAEIQAECNYWGDPSGPYNISNPSGIGDNVSGNVEFIPWLTSYPDGECMGYPGPVTNIDTEEQFTTIQAAIDDVDTIAGHTILANAGTYTEDVIVDKAVTVRGIAAIDTIIDGKVNVNADGATLKYFTIAPTTIYSGNEAGVTIGANDVTVEENIIDGVTGDGTGWFTIKGIHIYGGNTQISDILIQNNEIKNIHNQNDSDMSHYGGADGIMVQGNCTGIDIIGNTITDIHSSGWAYGMSVTPTNIPPNYPTPQNVLITENTIDTVNDGSVYNSVYEGVAFSLDETSGGADDGDASQVTLEYNNFINIAYGAVNKDTSETLFAECNWWGDATGPYNATENPSGMGAEIIGDISFLPWLDDVYPDGSCNGGLEQLDINQSTFDRGFPIRAAIDGDWAGAQNFTPTMSAITKAEVYIRAFGTPEFDLTVELRENDPEGTLLDSVTVPVGDVPTSWTWFEVDFADVTVSSGTDYFIVCPPAPSGVTTSFGYEWGYAFGDQYPDGSFWFTRDGGNLWRDLPTMYEFVFKTFGY